VLKRIEQPSAHLRAGDVVREREEDDPALRVRGPSDSRTDEVLALDGNHRMILTTRGDHLRQRINRTRRTVAGILMQAHDPVQVIIVKIANRGSAHRRPPPIGLCVETWTPPRRLLGSPAKVRRGQTTRGEG